jgi:hypothetical protein
VIVHLPTEHRTVDGVVDGFLEMLSVPSATWCTWLKVLGVEDALALVPSSGGGIMCLWPGV